MNVITSRSEDWSWHMISIVACLHHLHMVAILHVCAHHICGELHIQCCADHLEHYIPILCLSASWQNSLMFQCCMPEWHLFYLACFSLSYMLLFLVFSTCCIPIPLMFIIFGLPKPFYLAFPFTYLLYLVVPLKIYFTCFSLLRARIAPLKAGPISGKPCWVCVTESFCFRMQKLSWLIFLTGYHGKFLI